MTAPMVSVILPTYNRAHLLPEVLDSILGQNFLNFELIVVDDGSRDSTESLIKEFQARDSRIYYKKLPRNMGLPNARNEGLRNIRGKYVALADSDDLWEKRKLSRQIQVLEAHPLVGVLFSDFWDVDEVKDERIKGFEKFTTIRKLKTNRLADRVFIIEDGLIETLLAGNFIANPTVIINRDVFDRCGFFDTSLTMSEDLELWVRFSLCGVKFAFIDEPLIERRIHPESITGQKEKAWNNRIFTLLKIRDEMEAAGRLDLIPYFKSSLKRTYHNLLRIYGQKWRVDKSLCTFIRALKYGFDLKSLGWFLLSLTGPLGIALFTKLRNRL